jgi:hypothetical protein
VGIADNFSQNINFPLGLTLDVGVVSGLHAREAVWYSSRGLVVAVGDGVGVASSVLEASLSSSGFSIEVVSEIERFKPYTTVPRTTAVPVPIRIRWLFADTIRRTVDGESVPVT